MEIISYKRPYRNISFKFIPFHRLEDFLSQGKVWFSRADKFGDKMECVRIGDLTKIPLNYKSIENRKRMILISCWHLADKESLAFWDTYSDNLENRKNIAIKFKRETLLNSFNEYFHRNDTFYYQTEWLHGKVQYKNLINAKSDVLNQCRIKYPPFRKEKAFSYENEYRFVIQKVDEHSQDGFGYFIGEPANLSFEILINPLLNKTEFADLKNRIIKLGFESKINDSILTKWLRPDIW
ncbi:MAG: hypothetical protein IPI66_02660 [Chitinophagaceae bacterium]|nr:hypothetical protein [Chitinophagaceae bacterium]